MRLRPRFSKILNLQVDDVNKLILNNVSCYNDKLQIEDNGYLKIISFPNEEQRIWTPQMEITLEEVDEGVKIRGSVGPNSKVWLLFSFLYFGFGLAFLASFFYGLSQYVLHHSYVYAMITSAIFLVLFASLYLFSFLGQMKSRSEIEVLSHCFISVTEDS